MAECFGSLPSDHTPDTTCTHHKSLGFRHSLTLLLLYSCLYCYSFVFLFLSFIMYYRWRKSNQEEMIGILFCGHWVKVRGDCSLSWYYWTFWPVLFKFSFHKLSNAGGFTCLFTISVRAFLPQLCLVVTITIDTHKIIQSTLTRISITRVMIK